MASLRTLALYILTLFLAVPLSHAVTWTIIDYPGARVTEGVFGINSQGQMVGAYVDFASSEHGFLDDDAFRDWPSRDDFGGRGHQLRT